MTGAYSIRPYTLHRVGCRHDGHPTPGQDCGGDPVRCTGCGVGHAIDEARARAVLAARVRKSCGICRPDVALGVPVVRLNPWCAENGVGGLYAKVTS